MNEITYRIARFIGETGEGSNRQFDVEVGAKAKYSPDNPYEVANEIVALRLGLALGLPIPIGGASRDQDKLYYISIHPAVESLPKATDADIASILENEKLACGIIAFDSWILNQDRWRRNISYLDGETFIFDHGRALFAGQRKEIEKNRSKISIGSHCLKDGLKSLAWFEFWHKRILMLPERFVRDSVELGTTLGCRVAKLSSWQTSFWTGANDSQVFFEMGEAMCFQAWTKG